MLLPQFETIRSAEKTNYNTLVLLELVCRRENWTMKPILQLLKNVIYEKNSEIHANELHIKEMKTWRIKRTKNRTYYWTKC
jgi:hypothetical protein